MRNSIIAGKKFLKQDFLINNLGIFFLLNSFIEHIFNKRPSLLKYKRNKEAKKKKLNQ